MPAPVRHTCPDIDKVIKRIKDALRWADEGKDITERGSNAYSLFDDIENELYRLDDMLEDLRSANASLREWGEELEEECNSKDNYIAELEEKVSEYSH